MTNYERIKAMSVEEMAEFITNYIRCEHCPVTDICWGNGGYNEDGNWCSCQKWFQQWLESEAENDR